MSYADAAASSGPIGAEKIASPPQVKHTTDPSGSVETLPEDEFNKLKKDAEKEAKKAKAAGKEHIGDFKKELHDLEERGEGYLNCFIKTVKSKYNDVSSYISKNTNSEKIASLQLELKNPVVITQALVGLGGVIGGYFTYLERHRIKSDNKVVLATHGAIITGLILIDGYLFKTYYPKYDKKKF